MEEDLMLDLLERRTVTVDGKAYRMVIGKYSGAKLEPGDMFFQSDRDGHNILVFRELQGRRVYAEGTSDSFDVDECVGVEEAD